jgi:hypothetical protein
VVVRCNGRRHAHNAVMMILTMHTQNHHQTRINRAGR